MYRPAYYQQLSKRMGAMSVREKYDIDRHDERLKTLRLLTTLLAIFYFSYTLVDIYLLPDIALRSLLLRGLVMLPLTFFLFAYYKRSVSIRRKELAAVLVISLSAVVWCAILLGSENERVLSYFYAGLVFLMVLTIVLTPPFEQSLYSSLFVFACLYSSIWFLSGSTSFYVINHLSLGVPVLVLTLMANYRFSAESLRLYLENVSVEQLREELAARNEELERISHIDPLTGLTNRRGLTRYADDLQQHPNAQRCIAAMLIDVDHFKAFNDFYGHSEGDNCLRDVANAIRDACKAEDMVCRFGGEEFLVLRSDIHSSASEILALAEDIRVKVMELAIPHQPTQEMQVTISVGVCVASVVTNTELGTLIKAADAALYEAKRQGRNRVRLNSHPDHDSDLAQLSVGNINPAL
ncbi:diguanylate cyclase domain-containing protein [Halomonas sp. DWK9]|uniref:GGDEF domain-containing protein n=1 Tax=Halomonas sp. DWK9 TaxID=3060155 RepID=UPI00287F4F44|nr:diguanylate cyclase [Halomonas sp. DWK9]